jgi:hypothetical protein
MYAGERVRAQTSACTDFKLFTFFPLVDYIYNSSSLSPSILLSRAAFPSHFDGTGSESQSGNTALIEFFILLLSTLVHTRYIRNATLTF